MSASMWSPLVAAAAVLGVGLALLGDAAPGEPGAVPLETASLDILTPGGSHRLTVEVAATGEERARGLMFRRRLAPDSGMLLLYEAETRVGIWMKNTYLSLDILFISRDGRIVDLIERAAPLSTDVMWSPSPVRAVLEVAAGTAARLGIGTGDRVRHPVFGPEAEVGPEAGAGPEAEAGEGAGEGP